MSDKPGDKWTLEEDKILINNTHIGIPDIVTLLPHRTRGGIYCRYKILGIVNKIASKNRLTLSEEEIQFIYNNLDMTTRFIAKKLNRGHELVKREIKKLGLSATGSKRKWLKKDDEFLINNFRKMSYIEIGKNIGKSHKAVEGRCYHLNLLSKDKHIKCDNRYHKGHEEISMVFFGRIKAGAKKRNKEFSISIEYIWELFLKQDRKCTLSGINLSFAVSTIKKSDTTASLDRIDSSKGYIEGNVQWVHKDINRMKMDFTEDYFRKLCKHVAEINPEC